MPRLKPKSRSQKWAEERIAKGLCGYCGKGPIAYPRSRSRCKDCLERLKTSRLDCAVRSSSLFAQSA
jgi:hypothetical protein